MQRARCLTAAAAVALLAVGPLAGFANAAGSATGVGTGTVTATALSVQLGANGDLLSVRVLGDDGTSTIDPAKGTPLSTETLNPLTISSKTVPALNVSTPSIATTSTGAEDKKALPDASLPQSAVFSGQINALLTSIVDGSGARSGLQAGLANLKLAGGLVNIPTGVVQVGTSAAGTNAAGTRSITIPAINVLDLSAVLEGLGLDLADLPINDLLDLLRGLGVPVPDVADPAAAVTGLNRAIDFLQTQSGDVTSSICSTVDGLLAPLGGVTGALGLGGLPDTSTDPTSALPTLPESPVTPGGKVDLPPISLLSLKAAGGVQAAAAADCANLVGTVNDLLDQVQSSLADLLQGILALLDSTPLLAVTDVNVGLVARATDTVGTSVADVTASIGSVKVGNLTLPGVSGLDLTDTADTINQAVATIQSAIGSVLGTINVSLDDLVKVDILQIVKGVSAAGGYTNATSSVTALRATLDPSALLGAAALVDQAATPVSAVLGGLGAPVPALAPLMGQLEGALGGIQALSGPSVVTVGQLSGSAAFRAVAGSPGGTLPGSGGGTLPRTGRDAALPAMMAVLLGGAALAIRKVLRTATPS